MREFLEMAGIVLLVAASAFTIVFVQVFACSFAWHAERRSDG